MSYVLSIFFASACSILRKVVGVSAHSPAPSTFSMHSPLAFGTGTLGGLLSMQREFHFLECPQFQRLMVTVLLLMRETSMWMVVRMEVLWMRECEMAGTTVVYLCLRMEIPI